ncbi:hypothetical protein EVAR_43858_1 [Eumeta japonica]|uniref:Uncharacterized protein n=1 Tax=Eumeta variegata TaxID=151549 RepID=A0A4C1X159_EUMVA|nr:hypothetical protein EVAR_43858_1 [Eumeta japonica]
MTPHHRRTHTRTGYHRQYRHAIGKPGSRAVDWTTLGQLGRSTKPDQLSRSREFRRPTSVHHPIKYTTPTRESDDRHPHTRRFVEQVFSQLYYITTLAPPGTAAPGRAPRHAFPLQIRGWIAFENRTEIRITINNMMNRYEGMKLMILGLLALAACACARTTSRQSASPVRAQSITSLSDRVSGSRLVIIVSYSAICDLYSQCLASSSG